MWLSADVMRIMLYITLFGMALLSALYLSRRILTLPEYFKYSLLILFVPLLGPFLVILSQPGQPIPPLSARERRLKRQSSRKFWPF